MESEHKLSIETPMMNQHDVIEHAKKLEAMIVRMAKHVGLELKNDILAFEGHFYKNVEGVPALDSSVPTPSSSDAKAPDAIVPAVDGSQVPVLPEAGQVAESVSPPSPVEGHDASGSDQEGAAGNAQAPESVAASPNSAPLNISEEPVQNVPVGDSSGSSH